MRLSTEHHDYGWRVFLDGVELKYCVEADDVAGYAIQLKCNAQGLLMVSGGDVERERLTGRVKLIPMTLGLRPRGPQPPASGSVHSAPTGILRSTP